MEYLNVFMYVILLIVGYFVGLFTRFYYPKYMQQKGKNLATIEDIGKITTIVESIKTDLDRETEELKSELSLKSQNLINIKKEQRAALLNYYVKYSKWHNVLKNLPAFESLIDIIEFKKQNNFIVMEYYEANSLVQLFYNQKEFIELKQSVFTEIMNGQFLVDSYLIDLHELFYNVENKLDRINKEHYEKRLSLFNEFNNKFISIYEKISFNDVRILSMIGKYFKDNEI